MLPFKDVIQLDVHHCCHCTFFRAEKETGGRERAHLNMISLFQRWEGGYRAGAVTNVGGWSRAGERGITLTGRAKSAEGESLNVLG